MMNVILNWTPGAGVVSQLVKYKLATLASSPESNWTTFGSSLGPTINTVTVTGLTDNLIYDFKVVSVCQNDVQTSSPSVQQINITCASVTVTPTTDSVTYSFTPVGGSVNGYTVQLLDSSNVLITSQTPTGSPTLSGTFTGLTPSTETVTVTYKIKVIQTAGSFSKSDCPLTSFSTLTSTCNAASSLTASIAP